MAMERSLHAAKMQSSSGGYGQRSQRARGHLAALLGAHTPRKNVLIEGDGDSYGDSRPIRAVGCTENVRFC
jgi:hypothetical protein